MSGHAVIPNFTARWGPDLQQVRAGDGNRTRVASLEVRQKGVRRHARTYICSGQRHDGFRGRPPESTLVPPDRARGGHAGGTVILLLRAS